MPGNPYDGHTLGKVIPAMTRQIGASLTRVIADAGHRGHNARPRRQWPSKSGKTLHRTDIEFNQPKTRSLPCSAGFAPTDNAVSLGL
jgi:hypothetical protein